MTHISSNHISGNHASKRERNTRVIVAISIMAMLGNLEFGIFEPFQIWKTCPFMLEIPFHFVITLCETQLSAEDRSF